MGIDSFSIFLKRYAPHSYFEIPLESLQGKRIAIDMNNLAFVMMAPSVKEIVSQTNLADGPPDQTLINIRTLDRILHRLEAFMQYSITPVCVFDGEPVPLKKSHVGEKRLQKRNQIKTKLETAKQQLYSAEPLLRNQQLIDEYERYLKQNICVDFSFMEQLKNILQASGFVVLLTEDFDLATNDAEALCASLCLKGNDYCFAALTTDTDFHTYGGVNAIIDIEVRSKIRDGHRYQMHYVKIRNLEAILQQTGLSFDSFQDLCILMGTDFNPNIPGIGPVKGWDLIQKYGTVPNIPRGIDTNVLNYPDVKKIFTSTLVKIEIPNLEFNWEVFCSHARDVFNIHGMKDHASIISNFRSEPERHLLNAT